MGLTDDGLRNLDGTNKAMFPKGGSGEGEISGRCGGVEGVDVRRQTQSVTAMDKGSANGKKVCKRRKRGKYVPDEQEPL